MPADPPVTQSVPRSSHSQQRVDEKACSCLVLCESCDISWENVAAFTWGAGSSLRIHSVMCLLLWRNLCWSLVIFCTESLQKMTIFSFELHSNLFFLTTSAIACWLGWSLLLKLQVSSERILGLLTLAGQLLRQWHARLTTQTHCGYWLLQRRTKKYQRYGFCWETMYKFTVSWWIFEGCEFIECWDLCTNASCLEINEHGPSFQSSYFLILWHFVHLWRCADTLYGIQMSAHRL